MFDKYIFIACYQSRAGQLYQNMIDEISAMPAVVKALQSFDTK